MGYAEGWWEQLFFVELSSRDTLIIIECAAALQVNWANTPSLLATEGGKKTDVGYFIETFYKEQEHVSMKWP